MTPKRKSRRTVVSATMITEISLENGDILHRTLTMRSFVSIATDAGRVFDMVRKLGAMATMMTLT